MVEVTLIKIGKGKNSKYYVYDTTEIKLISKHTYYKLSKILNKEKTELAKKIVSNSGWI
jgi:hypothetical protein